MSRLLSTEKVGTIKRVLKQDGEFVCGLCIAHYSQFNDAQDCLESCWSLMLSFEPFVLRGQRKGVFFRCRFCARDHMTRDQAIICAKDCLAKNNLEFDRERNFLDYIAPAKKKKARPKFRSFVPSGNNNLAKKTVVHEIERNPDEHTTSMRVSEAIPISADVEIPTSVEAPPPNVPQEGEAVAKKKREKDEGFFRDGARYVCQVCQKKYFTKEDVVACFKGHKNG